MLSPPLQIDDDVVYIERHALARLAAHKIFHSSVAFQQHGLAVANVVNHGHLPYVHAALGAWPGYANLSYHGHTRSMSRTRPNTVRTIYISAANTMHKHFLAHERKGNTSAYHFQAWDLNACRCTGLVSNFYNRCAAERYYRWGINAIAFGGGFVMSGSPMPVPMPDNNDEWWIVAGWQSGKSQMGVSFPSGKSQSGTAWQSGESQSGSRVRRKHVPARAEPPHSEVVGSAVVVHYAYNRQRRTGLDPNGKLLRAYSKLGAKLQRELLEANNTSQGGKDGRTLAGEDGVRRQEARAREPSRAAAVLRLSLRLGL